MTEKSLTVVFDSKGCKVYDTEKCTINGKVQVTATKIGRFYQLDQRQSTVRSDAILHGIDYVNTRDGHDYIDT